MDKKEMKMIIRQKTKIPFILALIGAVVMAACVFLPYSTATDERAEWIDRYSDAVVLESMDLTAEDLRNVSLAEYAHIYYEMSEEYWHDTTIGIIYIVLVAAVCAGAVIAALYALGRKPLGCILFGAFSCHVFRVLNLDFTDRGVIPSYSYDWGIAHTLFPVAAAILAVGAVWMFRQKMKVKKQLKEQLAAARTMGNEEDRLSV